MRPRTDDELFALSERMGAPDMAFTLDEVTPPEDLGEAQSVVDSMAYSAPTPQVQQPPDAPVAPAPASPYQSVIDALEARSRQSSDRWEQVRRALAQREQAAGQQASELQPRAEQLQTRQRRMGIAALAAALAGRHSGGVGGGLGRAARSLTPALAAGTQAVDQRPAQQLQAALAARQQAREAQVAAQQQRNEELLEQLKMRQQAARGQAQEMDATARRDLAAQQAAERHRHNLSTEQLRREAIEAANRRNERHAQAMERAGGYRGGDGGGGSSFPVEGRSMGAEERAARGAYIQHIVESRPELVQQAQILTQQAREADPDATEITPEQIAGQMFDGLSGKNRQLVMRNYLNAGSTTSERNAARREWDQLDTSVRQLSRQLGGVLPMVGATRRALNAFRGLTPVQARAVLAGPDSISQLSGDEMAEARAAYQSLRLARGKQLSGAAVSESERAMIDAALNLGRYSSQRDAIRGIQAMLQELEVIVRNEGAAAGPEAMRRYRDNYRRIDSLWQEVRSEGGEQ